MPYPLAAHQAGVGSHKPPVQGTDGPSLVQQAVNTAASGTSLAVTISAPGAGHSLIAIICCKTGATVTGVVGGGVTWVQGPSVNTNGKRVEIWYGHGSTGSGTTITINSSTSIGNSNAANVSEWLGLSNAAPEATGTGTNAGSSAATAGAVMPVST